MVAQRSAAGGGAGADAVGFNVLRDLDAGIGGEGAGGGEPEGAGLGGLAEGFVDQANAVIQIGGRLGMLSGVASLGAEG